MNRIASGLRFGLAIFASVLLLTLSGTALAQDESGVNAEKSADEPAEKSTDENAGKSAGVHAEKSADEIAKELSNPASPMASLLFDVEYTTFKGDIPGADSQDQWILKHQPVLPFPVGDKGNNIIFRPLFPFALSKPIYNAGDGSWRNSDINLLDMSGQVVLAGNKMKDAHHGFGWGVGMNYIFPTATNDAFKGHRWGLGPTLFGALIRKWGLVGLVLQHSWRVAGSNHEDLSVTSGQYFIAKTLGNGWQFSTSPNFAYDHKASSGNHFTFPVGVGLAKTTRIGKVPVKFTGEIQYYVAQADTIGPDWLFKFAVTPVIPNVFADMMHH